MCGTQGNDLSAKLLEIRNRAERMNYCEDPLPEVHLYMLFKALNNLAPNFSERKVLCFPKAQTHFEEFGRQFDIIPTKYIIRGKSVIVT